MARSGQHYDTSNNDTNAMAFFFEQRLKNLHTALPVRVVKVFPQKPGEEKQGTYGVGFVNVSLEIDQVDNEDKIIKTHPAYNLPYSRIQGGECALVIDPKPGDIGWAIFCERDISKFKRTRTRSLPDSLRMHSQGDGIYLGGILNKEPRLYVQVHEDGGVCIECDNQNLTVRCVKAEVTAMEKVCFNTPVLEVTGDVVCKTGSRNISLDKHLHSGVEPGGGNTNIPLSAEAYG